MYLVLRTLMRQGHCFCRLLGVLCGGVTEWVTVVAVQLVVVVKILMYNVSLTHSC